MSFKRDGDDFSQLNLLKKRRVSELLTGHVPEDEAVLMKNGRYACMVCFHRPVFDTVDMLVVHRGGKKHKRCEEKFFAQKKELMRLKFKRVQEESLRKSVPRTTNIQEDPAPLLSQAQNVSQSFLLKSAPYNPVSWSKGKLESFQSEYNKKYGFFQSTMKQQQRTLRASQNKTNSGIPSTSTNSATAMSEPGIPSISTKVKCQPTIKARIKNYTGFEEEIKMEFKPYVSKRIKKSGPTSCFLKSTTDQNLVERERCQDYSMAECLHVSSDEDSLDGVLLSDGELDTKDVIIPVVYFEDGEANSNHNSSVSGLKPYVSKRNTKSGLISAQSSTSNEISDRGGSPVKYPERDNLDIPSGNASLDQQVCESETNTRNKVKSVRSFGDGQARFSESAHCRVEPMIHKTEETYLDDKQREVIRGDNSSCTDVPTEYFKVFGANNAFRTSLATKSWGKPELTLKKCNSDQFFAKSFNKVTDKTASFKSANTPHTEVTGKLTREKFCLDMGIPKAATNDRMHTNQLDSSLPKLCQDNLKSDKAVPCHHVCMKAGNGGKRVKGEVSGKMSKYTEERKEELETYLHLTSSGWIRERSGDWAKDEEVEFDSDEEAPS